jgi:hypothetical protein
MQTSPAHAQSDAADAGVRHAAAHAPSLDVLIVEAMLFSVGLWIVGSLTHDEPLPPCAVVLTLVCWLLASMTTLDKGVSVVCSPRLRFGRWLNPVNVA